MIQVNLGDKLSQRQIGKESQITIKWLTRDKSTRGIGGSKHSNTITQTTMTNMINTPRETSITKSLPHTKPYKFPTQLVHFRTTSQARCWVNYALI